MSNVYWWFKPNQYTTKLDITIRFSDDSESEYTFQKDSEGKWQPTEEPSTISVVSDEEQIIIRNGELSSKLIIDFKTVSSNEEKSIEDDIHDNGGAGDFFLLKIAKNKYDSNYYYTLCSYDPWEHITMGSSDIIEYILPETTSFEFPATTGLDGATPEGWCMVDERFSGFETYPSILKAGEGYMIPMPNKIINGTSTPHLDWQITDNSGVLTINQSKLNNIKSALKENQRVASVIPVVKMSGGNAGSCWPAGGLEPLEVTM